MNENAFIEIVRRRRECVQIVSRIERDLDIDRLASRLNKISARRRGKRGGRR